MNNFNNALVLDNDMTPKDLKKLCDKNIVTKKTLKSKCKTTDSVKIFETKISIQEDTNLVIGNNSYIVTFIHLVEKILLLLVITVN